MTLTFESTERLKTVFVCVRPGMLFPAASYRGAILELGGTTEDAEALLERRLPELARSLRRLPKVSSATFWAMARPIYEATDEPVVAQALRILDSEGARVCELDPREALGLMADALRRIFEVEQVHPRVFFDGRCVAHLPAPEPGAGLQTRRAFRYETEENLSAVVDAVVKRRQQTAA
jgi:hypothetical protein